MPTNPRTARPEVHSDFQHFDERASQGKTALVSMIAIEPDKKKFKPHRTAFLGNQRREECGGAERTQDGSKRSCEVDRTVL